MIYVALMFFGGCMIAMQSPVNAALARHTGTLEATFVSFAVGTCALGALCLAIGRGSAFQALQAPAWQWLGGLMGALMVFASIASVPRIGVLSAILAMILGNLLMAAVIDNFGWFGVPVTPFGLRRAAGFALVLAGLYFILSRGQSGL